jgi:hypothetical protein
MGQVLHKADSPDFEKCLASVSSAPATMLATSRLRTALMSGRPPSRLPNGRTLCCDRSSPC